MPPTASGGVSLVLDIPNGRARSQGLHRRSRSSLHEPTGDIDADRRPSTPTAPSISATIDPTTGVSIEATLRNDSGAAVGYGRTAAAAALRRRREIVVPVRRPIAYIAGTVSTRHERRTRRRRPAWTEAPATFSDLSVGDDARRHDAARQPRGPDDRGRSEPVHGRPRRPATPTGALTGPRDAHAGVDRRSHGRRRAAGLDDRRRARRRRQRRRQAARDRHHDAAVRGRHHDRRGARARRRQLRAGRDRRRRRPRSTRSRSRTAARPPGPARRPPSCGGRRSAGERAGGAPVATGGFSDIATDRGHAYYVDACKGELGEASARDRCVEHADRGSRRRQADRARGVERPGVHRRRDSRRRRSASLAGGRRVDRRPTRRARCGPRPRSRCSTRSTSRTCSASSTRSSVVFDHLEIGAGGDYIALTTSAHFHGVASHRGELPRDDDRHRGAARVRRRDRRRSSSATAAGATASCRIGSTTSAAGSARRRPARPRPPTATLEHHIDSMTFLFGKK